MNVAVACAAKSPLGVDLGALVRACQVQVDRDFAPAWQVGCNLFLLDSLDDTDYAGIAILDDSDQANALGYHTTTRKGNPLGRVFVRTSGRGFTVTFSHELLEMLADPGADQVVQRLKTGTNYALEDGDPVQADSYLVDGIRLSNFSYPDWFNDAAPAGTRFDHLGVCTAPFQIRKGGYMPVQIKGQWTQIFGSEDARRAYLANEHDRSPRRGTAPPPSFQSSGGLMPAIPDTAFAAMEPSLEAQAMAMSLPWDKIRDVVQTFGPDVLKLGQDLLAGGFSVDWVVEAIRTLHPDILRLIDLWHQQAPTAMASLGIGIPSSLGGALLPWLLRTFGTKILDAVLPDELKSSADAILAWITRLIQERSVTAALEPGQVMGEGEPPTLGATTGGGS